MARFRFKHVCWLYWLLRLTGNNIPRWDEDHLVKQFGWIEGYCGRCGKELHNG